MSLGQIMLKTNMAQSLINIGKTFINSESSKFFNVLKEGFQTLTIPRTGRYSFEVIGAGTSFTGHKKELSGARIKGKIQLERGDRITVALGQESKGQIVSGSGATFVVKEGEIQLEPLFIASGAGYSSPNRIYGRASLSVPAEGNEKIGSSGVQVFQNGDVKNFFCAGAGFLESAKVERLSYQSQPPQSYSQGLMGGKGYEYLHKHELEGDFGGGGATFIRELNGEWKVYYGCGGGDTGGSSRIRDDKVCERGGEGSFSVDPNATFDHQFEDYAKCKIEFLN